MDGDNGASDDWLGWGGVQARIEDAYYDALVDFGFALGEIALDASDC